MRIGRLAFAVAAAASACADLSPSDARQQLCLDSDGGALASCPIVPSGTVCGGDPADLCAEVTLEQVQQTSSGACLRVVITNDCSSALYSDTCIAYEQGSSTLWQCWETSTDVGGTVDVSQCNATGDYWRIHTTRDGELAVLEDECPSP